MLSHADDARLDEKGLWGEGCIECGPESPNILLKCDFSQMYATTVRRCHERGVRNEVQELDLSHMYATSNNNTISVRTHTGLRHQRETSRNTWEEEFGSKHDQFEKNTHYSCWRLSDHEGAPKSGYTQQLHPKQKPKNPRETKCATLQT
jgi:hypothetical protein